MFTQRLTDGLILCSADKSRGDHWVNNELDQFYGNWLSRSKSQMWDEKMMITIWYMHESHKGDDNVKKSKTNPKWTNRKR